jgi:hypothetical protein
MCPTWAWRLLGVCQAFDTECALCHVETLHQLPEASFCCPEEHLLFENHGGSGRKLLMTPA